MKLKHMQVRRTYVPEAEMTVFYAFGTEDGKQYESYHELSDAAVKLFRSPFDLDMHVTKALSDSDTIREVTPEELAQRAAEMAGVAE